MTALMKTPVMHLDNLIEDLGGFGRYQILLTVLTGLAKITVVPSMLMMGFVGAEPDWWCVSRDNGSFENGSFKLCVQNGTCERRFTDAMVTVVSEWDLVCGSKWITNTIISVQMAGMLIGGMVAGYIADAHGRKKTLFIGLVLLAVGNIIAVFSMSWIMFMILRCFIGLAVAFVFVTFYLYQIEFVGKKWRVVMAAMPDWALGMVLHSLLSKWLHHWKWLHVACGCLGFAVLPSYFLLHESVRWLTVKGHLEEANQVVKKLAKMNRKPIPDTAILEAIAAEERTEGEKAKNYGYLHLFKTRNLAKKTTLTCFAWFASSIIYYGIFFGVKNLSGDIYLNMLLMSLTELPITPIGIGLSAVMKRRWASSLCYLLTCGACFGLAVSTRLAPDDDKNSIINALAMTAKVTISLGWIVIMALGVEQIPTVIRNLGYASHSTSARVGGVLAAQVLSLGGNDDLMAPFTAMGVLSFLTVVACLLLDETKGRPLQDTMKSGLNEKLKQDGLLKEERCEPLNIN